MRIFKLIATILADGSVDKKRYTVSFTEDTEVVKKMIEEFKEIENIKLNWKLDIHVNSCRARVYSKKLVVLLHTFSRSFRMRAYNVHPRNPEKLKNTRYPPTKIPEECFSKKEIIKEFLKYYITCDGGPEFSVYKRNDRNIIQLHMAIKIGCNNPKIKKQMYRMLRTMRINANERKDGFAIEANSEIKKFHELIGFMEESKVRRGKLFNGYKKNDVIKLMIFCKTLTQKSNWINKNFKSLEEMKRFLLDCIKLINDQKTLGKFVEQKLNIKI